MERLSRIWPQLGEVDARTRERLETDAKYAVYLDRQREEARLIQSEEARALPSDLDFDEIPGLSNELRQKLSARRPRSVGEAQRIEGMTPAALAVILTQARQSETRSRAA